MTNSPALRREGERTSYDSVGGAFKLTDTGQKWGSADAFGADSGRGLLQTIRKPTEEKLLRSGPNSRGTRRSQTVGKALGGSSSTGPQEKEIEPSEITWTPCTLGEVLRAGGRGKGGVWLAWLERLYGAKTWVQRDSPHAPQETQTFRVFLNARRREVRDSRGAQWTTTPPVHGATT